MPDSSLELARAALLNPAGMSESDLESVLGQLIGRSIDHADIYFQTSRHESWVLENGIVKEGSHNIEQGAGVRAITYTIVINV